MAAPITLFLLGTVGFGTSLLWYPGNFFRRPQAAFVAKLQCARSSYEPTRLSTNTGFRLLGLAGPFDPKIGRMVAEQALSRTSRRHLVITPKGDL
jgi:hypothetical protein